jgi:hypothetical protein
MGTEAFAPTKIAAAVEEGGANHPSLSPHLHCPPLPS